MNHFDGEVGSDLARVVPAHAVRDDKQAQFRPPTMVVLIHLPRTHIGPAAYGQIHITERIMTVGY
jgi:hypothetical protein